MELLLFYYNILMKVGKRIIFKREDLIKSAIKGMDRLGIVNKGLNVKECIDYLKNDKKSKNRKRFYKESSRKS